jgi:uncharacterized membrane protein SirB2
MNGLYLPLKYLHVGLALLSLGGFILRGAWMAAGSRLLQARWVKIAPQVVDTLFLLSGLGLAFLLAQHPFVDGWLTAKVLGLLGYILFGILALKRAPTRTLRLASFAAALACFAYIVGVAVAHDPASWWALRGGGTG